MFAADDAQSGKTRGTQRCREVTCETCLPGVRRVRYNAREMTEIYMQTDSQVVVVVLTLSLKSKESVVTQSC